MQKVETNGIVPIVPTPLANDSRVELKGLCLLLKFVAGSGACAVSLPAYASECRFLNRKIRAVAKGRRSIRAKLEGNGEPAGCGAAEAEYSADPVHKETC
jgi:hypothetical protein